MAGATIYYGFLSLKFTLGTIGIAAYSVMYKLYTVYFFLTIINYVSTYAFFLVLFIYQFKDKNSSTFYHFTINRWTKYIFTSNFTVVFGYWTLASLGTRYMEWSSDINQVIITLYMHLLIGLFILVEIIINDNRVYIYNVYYFDLVIMITLAVLYSILIHILAYSFNNPLYPFLKLEFHSSLACSMILWIYTLNSQQLYNTIMKKKIKT